MLNLELLRKNFDNMVENCAPYGDHSEDIRSHVQYLAEDLWTDLLHALGALDDGEEGYLEEAEELVIDFANALASLIEDSVGNGVANEWAEISLIYTSDIMEYYANNSEKCNDALANYGSNLNEMGGLSGAIDMAAHLALSWEIGDDIYYAARFVEEHGADEMVDGLA